jgi:feruloyl esterase
LVFGQHLDRAGGAISNCNDSIRTNFKPDANTTVTLVKEFKKGEILTLTSGAPPAPPHRTPGAGAGAEGGAGGFAGFGGLLPTPQAANDVCVVKLLIGPGHAGPPDAPSTSAGIGIEVWLPSSANWNNRVHVLGGGGCSREGDNVVSLTKLGGVRGSTVNESPAGIATGEGAVSAMTDTGHTVGDCSFAMNPDGSINTFGWNDFSERAIHEEVITAKALAKAYYGRAAQYSYWEGFSTGGRQGLKEAQLHPNDVDGILAGAPAINWNVFSIAGVYPSLVYEHELGGKALSAGQRALMGNAAINDCDMVGGVHLGYIPDPSKCNYDPARDPAVLCKADGGVNQTEDCVTPLQAQVQNKIWYGETADGGAPAPDRDNGWLIKLNGDHLWYGHARGATDGTANGIPFGIMPDYLALVLQDPKIAEPSFHNTSGNGENGYKNLSYSQLSGTISRGQSLQPKFDDIDTDNPDLSALKKSGTKLLHYHGLADNLIPPQGSINYYNRVAAKMGGLAAVQSYYRFYLIPSMTHGLGNGSTNRQANPPLPTHEQLYKALTDWVENGIAPARIDISTAPASYVVKSRPICPYPQTATYQSGDPNTAASYTCAVSANPTGAK